jgi:response regulator RpfG family c-di-GMP phosphodiesterase
VILLANLGNSKSIEDASMGGVLDYGVGVEDLRRLLLHAKSSARKPFEESPEQKSIKDHFFNLTDLLVSILEAEDPFFSGNSHTVMHLSRGLAAKMLLGQDMVDAITLAAVLRDIGKIGVKQQILNQSRSLTNDEFLSVQDHCQTSVKLLKRLNLPWRIDEIILHHHEHYDGGGYPSGLKGREIPIGARILAVVDSFVAMTTDRPHRTALSKNAAIQEMLQKAGTYYDPEVVQLFITVVEADCRQSNGNRKRVLLVDDQTYMLTLMKLHMINEGFDVSTAENGDEAIERIGEQRPDLIVTDVLMPIMDGFTLRKVLSEDPALRDIPLIFLSSADNPECRVKGLKLGAADFISKPFDLEELSLKVNALLGEKAAKPKTRDEENWIHGRLQDMAVTEIIQFLNLGLKTAQVNLYHHRDNETGRIFFTRGEISFAATDTHQGEQAFLEMLRWTEGKFKIRHGVQKDTVNISKNTMNLLMDGMRKIDEENRDTPVEISG